MHRVSLLDDIYNCIAEPSRWADVLIRLADRFEGVGGMIIYNAPPGAGTHLMISGRLDPGVNDIFYKHHVWNPWTRAVQEQPFNKALVCGSLVERRFVHKTGFFADVLAPQKIEDLLVCSLPTLAKDGGVGGFCFGLSSRGVQSADRSRGELQRLTPHLSRAFDATLRLGSLSDGSRQLIRVLQLMPSAAFLIDRRQRVVHANPAAEALLRNHDGITTASSDGLQLSAVMIEERIALTRALARALAVADGRSDALGEPVRLTRSTGAAPLLVIPIPLPPPMFPMWELSDNARLLVLVIDPAARNMAFAGALRSAFGLTAAEARVATLIGSGLTGPQAAEALDVSPATVKTHLSRCFEKLGIRSQVDLARLIAALPNGRE